MVTACNQPLRSNPFITYRNPETGRWMVIVLTPSISAAQPDHQTSGNCGTETTA